MDFVASPGAPKAPFSGLLIQVIVINLKKKLSENADFSIFRILPLTISDEVVHVSGAFYKATKRCVSNASRGTVTRSMAQSKLLYAFQILFLPM